MLKSVFAVVLFLATPLQAFDIYSQAQRKQATKEAKRWSLGEWLAQKEKIKLMDSWLMFNPPNPYEFYLSADTASFQQSQGPEGSQPPQFTQRAYRGSAGAFVTAVGLHGEYEQSDETLKQWKALFMVRALGSSDQSTHLTLHYGLMGQDLNGDKTQFQVAGARTSFYLIKAFALTGQYEHIFKATSLDQQIEAQGQRIEGGAHLEYGALRIYGTWFQERLELTIPSVGNQIRTRSGLLYGLRLYF